MKWILCWIITCASYIFADDPAPKPDFDNLDFWGRHAYYMKQEIKLP